MDGARNLMLMIAGVATLLLASYSVVSIGSRIHEAKQRQAAAQVEQRKQADAAFKAFDEAMGGANGSR